ncbi:hypothetical protein [Flavobacterium polysaccharolyticum]|uniref:Uncharacterized protein n=1 Tax=Flavobacterium polysaccharolyticum TaxID=3133148 RepID=A0ABU9NJL7_9FLAO
MKKKHLWIIGFLTVIVLLSIPIFHILKTKWNEKDISIEIPKGFTNDASQLNLTKIDTIIKVPNNKKEIEIQLKNVLKYAKENNLKISIAGARPPALQSVLGNR